MNKDENGAFITATRDGLLVKINREGSMIEVPNKGSLSLNDVAGSSVVLKNNDGELRCLADVPESSSPCTWTFSASNTLYANNSYSLENIIEQERIELNGKL